MLFISGGQGADDLEAHIELDLNYVQHDNMAAGCF